MQDGGTFNLPPAASTIAPHVDSLFYFIYWASAIFFVIITIGTIFFICMYRKKKGEKSRLTPGFTHHVGLELLWSVIPAIIFMAIFFWGAKLFLRMYIIPADAMEIRVTGQQWNWLFKYPGGGKSDRLVVPDGKPVKLLLNSVDVIHSFFIPDFRVKMDALPNRYTSMWFQSDYQGDYDYYCTEYCGQQHSTMTGTLSVVSETDYAKWIEEISVTPPGDVLYKRFGCATCHSIDGSTGNGPTLKGLFGKKEEFTDGSSLVVDDNYLRESILDPNAKIVKGYEPLMPTFTSTINHEELDALIDFIKTLADHKKEE